MRAGSQSAHVISVKESGDVITSGITSLMLHQWLFGEVCCFCMSFMEQGRWDEHFHILTHLFESFSKPKCQTFAVYSFLNVIFCYCSCQVNKESLGFGLIVWQAGLWEMVNKKTFFVTLNVIITPFCGKSITDNIIVPSGVYLDTLVWCTSRGLWHVLLVIHGYSASNKWLLHTAKAQFLALTELIIKVNKTPTFSWATRNLFIFKEIQILIILKNIY